MTDKVKLFCKCPSCHRRVRLAWIGQAGVFRGFCPGCHKLVYAGEQGRSKIDKRYKPIGGSK